MGDPHFLLHGHLVFIHEAHTKPTAGVYDHRQKQIQDLCIYAEDEDGVEDEVGVTLEEAVERVFAGLEKKNRLINPEENKIVAYHEIGHAMVAMSLLGTDPVQKITIIPRGIAAPGYTIQAPSEDRLLMGRPNCSIISPPSLAGAQRKRLSSAIYPPEHTTTRPRPPG